MIDEYGPHLIANPHNLTSLTNLEVLYIQNSASSFDYDSLKKFVNLKELYILGEHPSYCLKEYRQRYGRNLEILDHFKYLKVLQSFHLFSLDTHEIQKRYPHVQFRWYFPFTNSYYQGSFSEGDGLLDGKGTLIYGNGDKYIGDFKKNKRDGSGSMFYSNGDRYVGEYRGDKKEGKGIFFFEYGDRYEGEFKNDAFDGKGIQYFFNGNRCEGYFRKGVLDGRGVFYISNEEQYEEAIDLK